jgi:hypothetical protein
VLPNVIYGPAASPAGLFFRTSQSNYHYQCMQTIEIKAQAFFETFFEKIKEHQLSMWDLLEQMIDGNEKMVLFLDEKNNILMQYLLPATKEKLKLDQKEFAQLFQDRISNKN